MCDIGIKSYQRLTFYHQRLTLVKGFIVTQATKKLDVRLPADMRDALDTLAEQRTAESKSTVKAADILREALALYLASKQISVSPDVNRGGNRRTA